MLCFKMVYGRLEHGVFNISRMRESATNRYKVFHIPVHWMLDNGFVSQVISMHQFGSYICLILPISSLYTLSDRLAHNQLSSMSH